MRKCSYSNIPRTHRTISWITLLLGRLYISIPWCTFMIAKKNRLTEYQLRKVLARKKPFFSYMFIANILQNKEKIGRAGILLSGKCTKWSVNRNFWRRKFYDLSLPYLEQWDCDIVFVPKKWIALNYKDSLQFAEFEKNITFLYKTIQKTQCSPLKNNKNLQ